MSDKNQAAAKMTTLERKALSALRRWQRENNRVFDGEISAYDDQISIALAEVAQKLLDADTRVRNRRRLSRLLLKIEEERRNAKRENDARPKVQTVTGAVAAAINGSGRGN